MTDILIYNARIRTMTSGDDGAVAEFTAVAIADGQIVQVGSDDELLRTVDAGAEAIDAQGATLTPGLIDSHMHPVWGAELAVGIDFGGVTSLDRVREMIADVAARSPKDSWIRGWNLDYKVFPDGIHGSLLDEAAGGRPVFVLFYDLHTGLANAAGLQAAGVDGTEQFADASLVVSDNEGVPTGELREMPAYMLLTDAIPAEDQADVLDAITAILQESAAVGVTSAAVMDGRDRTLQLLDGLEARDGGLPVRLHVALWHQPGDSDELVDHRMNLLGKTGRHYDVSMIKMFIDGVIDSGTAWLHWPDSQGESTRPFWNSVERYAEVAARYHQAGFQLATHSCGDAGVAEAMKVYTTLDSTAGNGAHHRIEHLETLTDGDVEQLATTKTVASMQPLHMQWREADHSDPWTERLGTERVNRSFRTQDLIQAGVQVCLGSDWPVAEQDPRIGMAWARLRRTPGEADAPVFEPEQRLTGLQALLGYTRWAADALGREDLGRIQPGARADLALWAQDPVDADADELVELPVQLTVRDGVIVHRG